MSASVTALANSAVRKVAGVHDAPGEASPSERQALWAGSSRMRPAPELSASFGSGRAVCRSTLGFCALL